MPVKTQTIYLGLYNILCQVFLIYSVLSTPLNISFLHTLVGDLFTLTFYLT